MKTVGSHLAGALVTVLTFVAAPSAWAQSPTPTISCTGDCQNDGEVTAADIELGIHFIFDGRVGLECPAYGPGQPTAASLLEAIGNLASMCGAAGPTSTPTPTSAIATSTPTSTGTGTATPTTMGGVPTATGIPLAVAGRTTIIVNALGAIPNVVAAIISGFEFGGAASAVAGQGGAAGACPLGGTATRTGNIPIVNIALNNCKVSTADGSATFNGSASINFTSFSVNITAVFADQGGTLTRTATATISGTVTPSFGGACTFTAATLTVSSGSLTVTTPDGVAVGVTFQNTQVVLNQITFNTDCVPVAYRLTFNGNAALLTPDGDPATVTFTNFVMDVDDTSDPTRFTLTGAMASPCFGGSVTVSTSTQIAVPSGELCPTAGVLQVTGASGTAQITYASDGSVIIDQGGTPQTYPTCLDPRLLMCLA